MKVAVGLRRVAAGKRTSGRRAAQIAYMEKTFLMAVLSFASTNMDDIFVLMILLK